MLLRGPGAPSTMTVTLEPMRLGRVRVELSTVDGELAVRLHAEHSRGVQAIGAGLDGLRSSLEREGLKLGGLGVDLAGNGSDRQFEANLGGGDQQPDWGTERPSFGPAGDPNAATTESRTTRTRQPILDDGQVDVDL